MEDKHWSVVSVSMSKCFFPTGGRKLGHYSARISLEFGMPFLTCGIFVQKLDFSDIHIWENVNRNLSEKEEIRMLTEYTQCLTFFTINLKFSFYFQMTFLLSQESFLCWSLRVQMFHSVIITSQLTDHFQAIIYLIQNTKFKCCQYSLGPERLFITAVWVHWKFGRGRAFVLSIPFYVQFVNIGLTFGSLFTCTLFSLAPGYSPLSTYAKTLKQSMQQMLWTSCVLW